MLHFIVINESQLHLLTGSNAESFNVVFQLSRLSRRKNVLRVDDIFATGATANEVAKTFKTAGAEKIYIFTLGRVIVVKGLDNEL